MTEDKLHIKPCPLCGNAVRVFGPEDWNPTFYDSDSGGDPVVLQCDCGLTFSIGSYDYHETYELWNRRTSDLGNISDDFYDEMFGKCKECQSKPSDTSNILCMCNDGMCLPRHPKGDCLSIQFSTCYEGEE